MDKENFFQAFSRYQYFLEVASSGSFSKAAERLCIKQSAISYQIAQMEKELGFRLINRTRPISLTPDGTKLKQEIEQAFHQLNNSVKEIRKLHSATKRLRFGIVDSLSTTVAPVLVQKLTALPIELSIRVGTSNDLLSLLDNNEIDVALISGVKSSPEYKETLLFREPALIVCPREFKGKLMNWNWQALSQTELPFMKFDKTQDSARFLNALFLQEGVHLKTSNFTLNDGGLMLSLIRMGLGWSILRPATLLHYPNLAEQVAVLSVPNRSMERKFKLLHKKMWDPRFSEEIERICLNIFSSNYREGLIRVIPFLKSYYAAENNR